MCDVETTVLNLNLYSLMVSFGGSSNTLQHGLKGYHPGVLHREPGASEIVWCKVNVRALTWPGFPCDAQFCH